jgi:tRNA(Arg) A34 adenosine deaminase TadA
MKQEKVIDQHKHFMRAAIQLSKRSLSQKQGGPFGAVVVRDEEIVARGWNQVIGTHDPTAHAEVVAIRKACRKLKRFHLEDCVIYTSCEPCPMCLSAVYWARLARIYYAGTRQDAARIGFQDRTLYRELILPTTKRQIPSQALLRSDAQQVMLQWMQMEGHVKY